MEKISNNLLLYGPPGTGKTYNVVNYAVAIIENRPLEDVIADGYDGNLEKYDRYTKMNRIAFMTFHQSLSYDDFIEGIRPEVTEDGSLIYTPTPGAFYKFCVSSESPQSTGVSTDVPRHRGEHEGRPRPFPILRAEKVHPETHPPKLQ